MGKVQEEVECRTDLSACAAWIDVRSPFNMRTANVNKA